MMSNCCRASVGKAALLLPLILVILLSIPPPASADQFSVAPGGSYTVIVNIKKPATLRLYEEKWEIRAYLYNSTSCYTTGAWWQPAGSSEWIYSGWYEHRFTGDYWVEQEETRTFNIRISVVNYPRSDEDKAKGMDDIPVGSTATLRIRFLIADIQPTFSGDPGEGSGMVSFTIGSVSYRYPYTVDQFGDIDISGQGLSAVISQDTTWGVQAYCRPRFLSIRERSGGNSRHHIYAKRLGGQPGLIHVARDRLQHTTGATDRAFICRGADGGRCGSISRAEEKGRGAPRRVEVLYPPVY